MSTSSSQQQQQQHIKFSNEESKANIRHKISQSIVNLIELTKGAVKSSDTHELFKGCFKNVIFNDSIVDNSCDKLKKIDILLTQLNFQVETLQTDCKALQEVCKQVNDIQKK